MMMDIKGSRAAVSLTMRHSKVHVQIRGTLRHGPIDPFVLVPPHMRSIVKVYIQSRMPQDEQRGRELCARYNIDYDRIRYEWCIDRAVTRK